MWTLTVARASLKIWASIQNRTQVASPQIWRRIKKNGPRPSKRNVWKLENFGEGDSYSANFPLLCHGCQLLHLCTPIASGCSSTNPPPPAHDKKSQGSPHPTISTTRMQPAYSELYPVIGCISINYTSCRNLEGGGGRLKERLKTKGEQDAGKIYNWDYLGLWYWGGNPVIVKPWQSPVWKKVPTLFPKHMSEAQVQKFHTPRPERWVDSTFSSMQPRKRSPFRLRFCQR